MNSLHAALASLLSPRRRATRSAPQRWQAPCAGRLVAQCSALWATQQGLPDDHRLQPGESLPVAAGAVYWLGPWVDAGPARVAAGAVPWRFEADAPVGLLSAAMRRFGLGGRRDWGGLSVNR